MKYKIHYSPFFNIAISNQSGSINQFNNQSTPEIDPMTDTSEENI